MGGVLALGAQHGTADGLRRYLVYFVGVLTTGLLSCTVQAFSALSCRWEHNTACRLCVLNEEGRRAKGTFRPSRKLHKPNECTFF